MSYNILEGGVDLNGSRIETIIDVINDVNPDFLAIQEANRFDENDFALLKMVSEQTNLPHYALSQGAVYEDGERNHAASFSRYPFNNVHRFEDDSFKCAALSVSIDCPVGKLSLCNIHLHPRSGDERLREIGVVQDFQSQFETNIILGDNNALSRLDTYGDLAAEEFSYYDLDKYDAIDMFIDKGFIDTVAYFDVKDRTTHPTLGWPHPVSKSQIRIDYIWADPSLLPLMKAANVIKTVDVENASDHRPVTLTLSDKPQPI